MSLFSKIANRWHNLFRRRRLALFSTRDNYEVWYTHISPVNLFMAVVAILLLLFMMVLTLVGYTPIMEVMPGYKSEAQRVREAMIENIVKIDSMERVITEMMLYSDNVGLIMSGKTPVVFENLTSSSSANEKALVMPSGLDSMLRVQMEGEGPYNLRIAKFGDEKVMVAPVDGIVSSHFDMEQGRLGVELVAAQGGRVMAAQRGVVVMAEWSPKSNHIIEILHPDNSLSIYRNIESITVTRGESIRAGAVIGSNSDEGGEATAIGFELWIGGRAVDPEEYITF